MRTTKTRHQFYLPDTLSAKLDALADQPGGSKTAILTDALTAWFEREAAAEIDHRFGPRFDRLTRTQARVEEKLDIITETLGAFIQHEMTLVAHQPPFDAATGQLGVERYRAFMATVGRRLAKRPDASTPTPDRERL
ncbi:CopG family transcriptional regulator [uncultured Sphingomonas sp.]|uniref:CopG family transcriptional regulator n=1 Tax=uncultured Sphingomonas sp. TaxID=158754 RepID=UPI0025E0F856|nr:CopG family transcriptional regulator [uncultured Sphingomonas sp.]